MKEKKLDLLLFGIFNAISAIPFNILASMFGLACVHWKILSDSLGYVFATACMLIISLLSPAFCIWGIVQGVRCWKSGYGRACFILSIIGILFYAATMAFLMNVSV
ncbi:MAG: hypothetical protein K2K17_00285 [Lachnospiraceae bacterium]|nr:hypothetical protein [Lachnospiraceae bacterium]